MITLTMPTWIATIILLVAVANAIAAGFGLWLQYRITKLDKELESAIQNACQR